MTRNVLLSVHVVLLSAYAGSMARAEPGSSAADPVGESAPRTPDQILELGRGYARFQEHCLRACERLAVAYTVDGRGTAKMTKTTAFILPRMIGDDRLVDEGRRIQQDLAALGKQPDPGISKYLEDPGKPLPRPPLADDQAIDVSMVVFQRLPLPWYPPAYGGFEQAIVRFSDGAVFAAPKFPERDDYLTDEGKKAAWLFVRSNIMTRGDLCHFDGFLAPACDFVWLPDRSLFCYDGQELGSLKVSYPGPGLDMRKLRPVLWRSHGGWTVLGTCAATYRGWVAYAYAYSPEGKTKFPLGSFPLPELLPEGQEKTDRDIAAWLGVDELFRTMFKDLLFWRPYVFGQLGLMVEGDIEADEPARREAEALLEGLGRPIDERTAEFQRREVPPPW